MVPRALFGSLQLHSVTSRAGCHAAVLMHTSRRLPRLARQRDGLQLGVERKARVAEAGAGVERRHVGDIVLAARAPPATCAHGC